MRPSACPVCQTPLPAGASAAACPTCTARAAASVSSGAGEATWYYAEQGRPIGPVTWAQLCTLAASGRLRRDDRVCRHGMNRWQTAGELANLFPPHPVPFPAPAFNVPAAAAPRPRRRVGWIVAATAACVALAAALIVGFRVFPVSNGNNETQSQSATELDWQFEYADDGSPTRIVDPARRETRIRYERDIKGRIARKITERHDGAQEAVEFDRFGRPTAIANASGTVRREYDGFGRLKAVRRDGAPALAYDYDAAGRVAVLRVGETNLLSHVYDFRGRLIRLETPAGAISYDYPPGNSQVRRKLPNGVQTIWRSLPDGALAMLQHLGPDGKLLLQFDYTYRPDGLVREVLETTPDGKRTLAYDYDPAGQLTSVVDSKKGTTTYRYDLVGNRTEVVCGGAAAIASVCDWAGRLTEHDGRPCAHDGAGNLTTYARGTEDVAVSHASDGRLATARTAAGEVQYQFDGDGNLVRRAVGASKTSYLPDPTADLWRPLLATEGDGKQVFYLWQDDKLLGSLAGKEAQFFLENHQGSVRCVTDATGKVVDRPDYDAFGVPNQRESGALRPGFTGLFHDPVACLYVTRARAYDPDLGRFLERDPEHRAPTGLPEDLSAYTYCGNDAINYFDVNGCASTRKVPYNSDLLSKEAVYYRRTNGISPGVNVAVVEYRDKNGALQSITVHSKGPGRHSEYEAYSQLRAMGVQPSQVTRVYSELQPCHYAKCDKGLKQFFPQAEVTYSFDHGHDKESRDRGRQEKRDALRTLGLNVRSPASPSEDSSIRNGPRSPGNVGGIQLRGIGEALKDLGPLQGIGVDSNGRLVLLTAEQEEVGLPPLRLEDVAVLFNAAYRHGESPYVSIDPDKTSPKGPTMDIRNSPGTESTYVGWILFEADRVMKAYSLGQDNLSKQPVRSSIADFQRILALGFDDPKREEKDKLWARFWIVPASVTRRHDRRGQLSLLDVPLKVDTEVAIPKDGKLEPVPGTKSRPSDEAFARWFGEHYDDLAREVWSVPPAESGMKDKVPVFLELRRIALVAAIAEQLRDRNVPLPSWLRDYPIKPFHMPRTTPTLEAKITKAGKGSITRFGGALMSPPLDAVRTVLSPEAEALAQPLLQAVAAAPAFQPVSFQHAGKTYKAVALPGDDSRALGACRLEEIDLAVSLPGGKAVRLTRAFDSFHQPVDVLGPGWTLDLPRIDGFQRIVRGEGKKKYFNSLYQLTSPLGTWSEFFGERREVPELPGAAISVPRTPGPMLGAWRENEENGGRTVVAFRDARRWYFDKAGRLGECRERPFAIVYERDAQGRVTRIEGRYGTDTRATIELAYDDQGRLTSATSSQGGSARYSYDATGRLTEVRCPAGVVGYRYQDGLVTEVLHDGRVVQQFAYTAEGQLRSEGGEGVKVMQEVAVVPEGVRITTVLEEQPEKKETILYDPSYRVLRDLMADGSRLDCKYEDGGGLSMTLTPAGGEPLSVRRSADAREEVWRLPTGGNCTIHYDSAGRPLEVLEDGRRVRHQEWRTDGLPKLIEGGYTSLEPIYDAAGVSKGLMLRPLGPASGNQGWMQVSYDGGGTRVTEQGGAVLRLDAAGQPVEWAPYENPQTREKKDRLTLKRDSQGRVQAVETTWGYREQNDYDAEGSLRSVEFTEGGKQAAVEFSKGRPTRLRQFDGSEVRFTYNEQGPAQGRAREARLPSGLVLKYDYDEQGRLAAAACGNAYRLVYRYDAAGRLTGLKQARGSE